MMSNAIFSRTPVKQVKSSTAPNSAKKNVGLPPSSSITRSSPRKYNIVSHVESNPSGNSNTINIKSRVEVTTCRKPQTSAQVKCPINQDNNVGSNRLHPGSREASTVESDQTEGTNMSSGATPKGNVKSMRTCFEHKSNNKIPLRPPPSPSRQRAHPVDLHPTTPRPTHTSLKGILTDKTKIGTTSSFRTPLRNAMSTARKNKLRRSASVDSLTKASNCPTRRKLAWTSNQNLTPKHVKFQDEVTPGCFSPVLLEAKGDQESSESIMGEHTNLTVAVRVRPPFHRETSVVSVGKNEVRVQVHAGPISLEHSFTYDHCFSSTDTQSKVFETLVQPLVDTAFQGYNVCLFAYGQTGSGKSYSMMGDVMGSTKIEPGTGIIPRFAKELFKTIETLEEYENTRVEISYFEIYNEKIHDLLGPGQSGRSAPLRVREHPELGPYVVDLTMHSVHSFDTLREWLCVGNNHRETAATQMNMNSSRSHSIFTVTLTQMQADKRPSLSCKINLIDLAGSERLALTCATGDRLKEGVSINRSLLTLGKVISSLAENKKQVFIPYRESVLTWLLKESLGGNSRTAMLATVSPGGQYTEETLSTLRYACQARSIVNTVRINESPQEKRIRELVEEINKMKSEIKEINHGECQKQQKLVEEQLITVKKDLTKANNVCKDYENEIKRLKNELCECIEGYERKVRDLNEKLTETNNNLIIRYSRQVSDFERDISLLKNQKFKYITQIEEMEDQISQLTESNDILGNEVDRFEEKENEFKKLIEELKSDNDRFDKELAECRAKNSTYESDINHMRNDMFHIKINSSHDHCDDQIHLLQTALQEAEQLNMSYEKKIKNLENKCPESATTSNHDGCEKEISTLKCMIYELKQSGDHTNCYQTIEKLKLALNENEKFITQLTHDINNLRETNDSLQIDKELTQKEIITIKNTMLNTKHILDHKECEDRISSLNKALHVATSRNTHIQCENKIIELEKQLRDMMSVTLMDHTQCDDKISNLFNAAEKYAAENARLMEKHNTEIKKYTGQIQQLEKDVSTLTKSESQVKLLKEENTQLKKKKLEDDKRIISLDHQVMSLTKELLEVKNQHRNCARDKESSESLCAQLQEQLSQQERKLALTPQCSKQLFDDKENWETPSKVIRRSIAKHAKSENSKSRCSLVMKVEEIHEAMKDAKEICSRLKIPWVFQLEPEVTTHSWFDVNIRVWDQRTMNSVRWPRSVFLDWLGDMKDEIMSKSRGLKMFQGSPWIQRTKESRDSTAELQCEPITESGHEKKERPLRDEVDSLSRQIAALESLCEPKDKREVLSAVTTLGKAVTQLSNRLGLSSPLKSLQTNINIKVTH